MPVPSLSRNDASCRTGPFGTALHPFVVGAGIGDRC